MYCNYCGKVIQDDANVCAYCGIRVGASLARTKLVRPRQGRKVAGVCLGFAEYFDLDVSLVRVVWLITAIMTCVGFIPYLIAWIVMPEEPYLLPRSRDRATHGDQLKAGRADFEFGYVGTAALGCPSRSDDFRQRKPRDSRFLKPKPQARDPARS